MKFALDLIPRIHVRIQLEGAGKNAQVKSDEDEDEVKMIKGSELSFLKSANV